MRFYQVHKTHSAGESAGYEYFTTRADADKLARAWRTDNPDEIDIKVKVIDVEPTKAGILRALNRYASHNDNG